LLLGLHTGRALDAGDLIGYRTAAARLTHSHDDIDRIVIGVAGVLATTATTATTTTGAALAGPGFGGVALGGAVVGVGILGCLALFVCPGGGFTTPTAATGTPAPATATAAGGLPVLALAGCGIGAFFDRGIIGVVVGAV